jgi:hypothetical protein
MRHITDYLEHAYQEAATPPLFGRFWPRKCVRRLLAQPVPGDGSAQLFFLEA